VQAQGPASDLEHELPVEGERLVRDRLRPPRERERHREGRRQGLHRVGRQVGGEVRDQARVGRQRYEVGLLTPGRPSRRSAPRPQPDTAEVAAADQGSASLGNPGVLPTIAGPLGLGLLLAFARLRSGGLWLSIGIHAAWVAIFRVGWLV